MPVIVVCDTPLCQRFDAMRLYEEGTYWLPKGFSREKQDGSYKYFCDPCMKIYQQEQRAKRIKP